jgi:tRNA1Val (adenine37-N6)-methyltransferase
MHNSDLLQEGEKTDFILDGRLGIIQSQKGYRFSIDALLLANFVKMQDGDDLIDMGTGSGIISVLLAKRMRQGRILGIEIQKQLVSIAKRNVQLNQLSDKITIIEGDIRFPDSFCLPQSFSVAVFNPPYRRLRSGRINPDPERAAARHEIFGTAADFIAAAAYALRLGGHMYAIYPSTKMAYLIAQMRSFHVEPKRLCIVYSRLGAPASFILIDGIKGGGEELDILPPFFVYNKKGVYTKQMDHIFRCLASFESRADG